MEIFTDVVRQETEPDVRKRLVEPCRQIPCVAVGLIVGWLAVTPAAIAQLSGDGGREARLVESGRSGPGGQAFAQTGGRGFAVGEISGPAATSIPIPVRIPEIKSGVYSFLVFRNLPEGFEISAGFPVDGQWVVPLDRAEKLSLKAPEDYRGSLELEIKLRIGGADNSHTLKVPVNILAPGVKERVASEPGEAQSMSEEYEQAMLDRAQAFLNTRDIAAARMIYHYLVQRGSGKAAYGLARTYDPAYVEELGVAGMNAQDIDQARKWYERAALLGHKEAQDRLKTMTAGTN